MTRRGDERGAAAVLALCLAALLATVSWLGVALGAAMVAHRRAAAAADLAALAGAVSLQRGRDPCAASAAVAEANGASVAGCALDGRAGVVSVVVAVSAKLPVIGSAAVRESARAGPAASAGAAPRLR